MLALLAAAALAAAPLTVYVETFSGPKPEQGRAFAEIVAQDLRKRGFRVTTQEELAQLMSGDAQRQKLGCEDKDCGIDRDIMSRADVKLTGLVIDIGKMMVQLKSYRLKQNRGPWGYAEASDSDVGDALRAAVPALLADMRKNTLPGDNLPPEEAGGSSSTEPKSADAHKRCAAAPGALALSGLLALLWRRRWWNWRRKTG